MDLSLSLSLSTSPSAAAHLIPARRVLFSLSLRRRFLIFAGLPCFYVFILLSQFFFFFDAVGWLAVTK
jgi:hypothetical protein